jgi:hypothetical protein
MPCSPSKLKQLDTMLDEWLKARQEPDYFDDEDEDEEEQLSNPLEASPPYGDRNEKSPPQSIHGERE